jgi:hypothetical protein
MGAHVQGVARRSFNDYGGGNSRGGGGGGFHNNNDYNPFDDESGKSSFK